MHLPVKALTIAKSRLRTLASHPQAVIVYDNFNFKDTVSEQALGSSRPVMRNLTSALLIICPKIPTSGLQQSMLNTSQPLRLHDILTAPGLRRDSVSRKISLYHIATAIRKIHPEAVDAIFKDEPDLFPQMPQLELLAPRKTALQQLGAIFEDEGTIEGTYGVHTDIWIRKLGFKEDDQSHHFGQRLWLAWGDQKTAQHIRSVKTEQCLASQAFDRRDWLLGPCAFFHVLQSFLFLIVRTHWESLPGAHSRCTLLHDIGYWDRRGITRENAKYHLVEPLIMQGWTARVLAIWYDVLGSNRRFRGVKTTAKTQKSTFDMAAEQLTPTQFLDYIEEVRDRAFTYQAWTGSKHKDKEFLSMCRYLQQVEAFLTTRHAVRHGDIGLLRRLVDQLCVWFYGAEQVRYGYEMLHLRWLLSSQVATAELQRVVLASSVVNLHGRANSFKAVDLALEHVNCCYAIDMKMFKNSTHDLSKTFGQVALTSSYNAQLRAAVETAFGERTNSRHSSKSAVGDVFSLANYLWLEGCTRPRLHHDQSTVQFESTLR